MTELDLRRRVCDQATAWLGRKEADGSHRVIIDVYNSIRPLPRGYRMTYADPWCAAFVSAVGKVCNLTDILYPECACDPMIALYKKAGRWMEDDAYVPKPGDIIMYDWDDNGYGDNCGSSDHVGIVTGVSGNVINIIEGNCSNMVMRTARQLNSRYIRGFCLPDYAAAAEAEEVIIEDGGAPGIDVGDKPEEPESNTAPGGPEPGVPDQGTVTLPAQRCKTCEVTLPMLRSGDAGEDVRAMQSLLIARGYDCGPAGSDGDFGPDTYGAVTRFQRKKGIEVDGIVGPETWRKLICE